MDLTSRKRLNNGVEMPMLGLGLWKVSEEGQATQTVQWAIEAGYRHLDNAAAYKNEREVGEGIRQSGIDRKELFITTKMANKNQRQSTQMEAFENSLAELGTDYVDLYMLHWAIPGKIEESWHVLEEIYAQGRAKAIGVCNFNDHHIKTLMASAKVIPAVNQIELHPRMTQEPLRAYCESMGIAVEAWSPLGGTGGSLLSDPTLIELGKRYGKSPAQVVLRWDLQNGVIVIPKSVHKERIIQNTELFDFELSDEDMRTIDGLNRNERTFGDPDNVTIMPSELEEESK